MDRDSACLQPREIEQVGNQAVQPVGLLLDRDRPIVPARTEVMGQGLDCREWSPKVVRHGGDQRVLQTVRLPQHFGAIGLGGQANPLYSQRGVVRQDGEEAALSRIESGQVFVAELQDAHDMVPDPEWNQ